MALAAWAGILAFCIAISFRRNVCPLAWPAVGEYRALVLSVEGQPKLCDRLIAALGLQKGWPEARQHALSAVQPDFLVRWVPAREGARARAEDPGPRKGDGRML